MVKYRVERTDGTPIPEDEPCFVVRAQDKLAEQAVREYFVLARKNGSSTPFLKEIDAHLARIIKWQESNPGKVKNPD